MPNNLRTKVKVIFISPCLIQLRIISFKELYKKFLFLFLARPSIRLFLFLKNLTANVVKRPHEEILRSKIPSLIKNLCNTSIPYQGASSLEGIFCMSHIARRPTEREKNKTKNTVPLESFTTTAPAPTSRAHHYARDCTGTLVGHIPLPTTKHNTLKLIQRR